MLHSTASGIGPAFWLSTVTPYALVLSMVIGCRAGDTYGIGTDCSVDDPCRLPLQCKNGHCAAPDPTYPGSAGARSTDTHAGSGGYSQLIYGGAASTQVATGGSASTLLQTGGTAPQKPTARFAADGTADGGTADGGTADGGTADGGTAGNVASEVAGAHAAHTGGVSGSPVLSLSPAGRLGFAPGGTGNWGLSSSMSGAGGGRGGYAGQGAIAGVAGTTALETMPWNNGHDCQQNDQCASLHCVDGVCCNGACTEQCKACNLDGNRGQCSTGYGAPVGPRQPCRSEPAPCAGSCSGGDSCTYPGSDVPCIGPATCSGEISSIAANYCDGAGSCSTTETVNCKSAERCGVNADGRCAMPYFTQVDMGYENTCALRSDGELYCWGLNAFGQLAVADLGAQSGPVRFPTTKPVRSVAVGFWHICVLHWDGQVDCWGHNGYDALGCETQVLEQQHCTPLKAGSSAVEIASANTHTCVRMENGTVKCWGRNDYGQLGSNNSIVPYSTGPVDVVGVTTARSLSVGLWHAGVIIGNSGVKTWGNNDHGQLGIESPPSIAYSAMLVTGLSGATAQLSATGTYHSCALLKDQSVWCFGDNTRGAFGYGSATYYDHPIQVRSSSAGVRAVATGDSITCTLTGEATVACSGKNDMGSLGDGTFEDSSTPVIVKWPVASMPRLRNIVAKYTSACAISESGRIWCWGDGTATGVPIEVTQP